MKRGRIVEIVMISVIIVLVAIGGQHLLVVLGQHKPWGWLIIAGLMYLAVQGARAAYDPSSPDARANVTKAGAYICAALLALWSVVLHEPHWIYGSCIVATEVALVFDLITIVAPRRIPGGN
jgi:drug/metabolite transporter superfamily protein YnfA